MDVRNRERYYPPDESDTARLRNSPTSPYILKKVAKRQVMITVLHLKSNRLVLPALIEGGDGVKKDLSKHIPT